MEFEKMKASLSKDEFEALNDVLKPEYKEKDGAYVLDVEGIDDHPAVKGLKGAYTAEKDKRSANARRLEELEAERKRIEEEKLTEQQKYKELAEIKDKESKEYADKLKALQDSVTQKEIESRANKIAAMINANDAKRQKFAAEEAKKFIKATDEGIKFFNPDGSPTDELAVKKYIETEFDFLASGNLASGGGANGNQSHTQHTAPPKTAQEAANAAFKGV